ncbi:MAG: type II toxin-antitoxin system RelE/ParE family toxin [Candidatus Amesbacteria bacterium]|nr:type II toxin-antitoxin system RelE/ParE family toxin [Candidatus Amesbacteria bacterium]
MWLVVVHPEASKFLDNLETVTRSKTRTCLALLRDYGSLLRQPHSKKIVGHKNLFELRTSGKSPIRLFYTHFQNKFYILHGFVKKTNKTPIREIDYAVKRQMLLTST